MQRAQVPDNSQKTASATAVGKTGRSFVAPGKQGLRPGQPMSCDVTAQAKGANGKPLQGVFQFFGDWLFDAVQAMWENPLVTIAALEVSALAIEAAYEYLTYTPPDRRTIAGVATVMDISPRALENHLENGPVNDQTYDSAPITNALPGTGIVKGLIPPSLITNTGVLQGAAKLTLIFNRLKNYPFYYSGIYTNGYNGFLRKAGDCQTLVQMFVLAAQAAGINGVEIKDKQNVEMLVTGAPIHGRATQGNVRNNTYWYFHEHYWAVYNGKRYDVLFMDNQTPTTYYYKQQKTYSNVDYKVFESGRCMIMRAELQNKLNITLGPNELGLVRNKEEDIKAYIRNPN